jgi:hypothetical protein
MTSGKGEAAEAINAYFINKVDSLRAESVGPATVAVDPTAEADDKATVVANMATEAADKATDWARFEFTFATAVKVAKIIRGLKATEAMGIDDIPTSV